MIIINFVRQSVPHQVQLGGAQGDIQAEKVDVRRGRGGPFFKVDVRKREGGGSDKSGPLAQQVWREKGLIPNKVVRCRDPRGSTSTVCIICRDQCSIQCSWRGLEMT